MATDLPLFARLRPPGDGMPARRYPFADGWLLTDDPVQLLEERSGPELGSSPCSGESWPHRPFRDSSFDEQDGIVTFDEAGFVAGGSRRVRCRFLGSVARLSVNGLATFDVSADGVACHSRQTEDRGTLEQALLGPGLLLALALRGVFTLHASAAARVPGDGVDLFLGESGAGKSTLAAALGERGWRPVADDLLPIRSLPGGPVALTDFPQLKRPVTVERRQEPVRRVFVLRTGEEVSLRPLSPSEASLSLIRHTATARLFPSRLLESHLEAAAAWMHRVPVLSLIYPRRRDVFDEVTAALGEHEEAR